MQNTNTEYKKTITLKASDNQLHTHVGKLIGRQMVSLGDEGCLLYGPYLPCLKGCYRLEVFGNILSQGRSSGHVEIMTSKGSVVIAKSILNSISCNGSIGTVEFELLEDVEDIEFRIWVSAEAIISVEHYEIFVNKNEIPKSNLNSLPWILMTGNIRNREEILSKLDFFHQLKKEGLIFEIVFSTWKGEIEKDLDILKKLEIINCIIVESDVPDIICLGHYVHQMTQLENGLDACPDNAFVLRTRTDKCGLKDGFIDEQIRNFLLQKNYIRSSPDNNIFLYKIGTFEPHTTVSLRSPVLFFWLDRWYFGYKQDLKKFINYSILSFDYEGLIPEQVLFSFPFRIYHKTLPLFFQAINQISTINIILFGQLLQDKMDSLTTFLQNNKLFRHSFLAERYILSNYFFDIPTGKNIPLITQYRGVEIAIEENSFFIASDCYNLEIEELQNYLKENFAIEPILQKEIIEDSMKRYIYYRKPL